MTTAVFGKLLPYDSLFIPLHFLALVQILQYMKLPSLLYISQVYFFKPRLEKFFVLWNWKELPLFLIVSIVFKFLL